MTDDAPGDDCPSDPDSSAPPEVNKLQNQVHQLEQQMFEHKMALKDHDHRMPSTLQQLQVMVMDIVFSVAGVVALLGLGGVVLGVTSIDGATEFLQYYVTFLVATGGCLILFMKALDFVQTMREPLPEIPDLDGLDHEKNADTEN